MPRPQLTRRDRMRRAKELAERLAHDLDVLGFTPQAEVARDLAHGLYQAQLDRAVADLAKP